jgi:sterol desaturase/sphingolipid hydroxylase (fatty acid hydroxylase superfamily)
VVRCVQAKEKLTHLANLFVNHEMEIRLACFGGVLLVVAVWEFLAPRRALSIGRETRWPSNLVLVALNSVMLRIAFPFAAVGMAGLAAERGWGVLNILAVDSGVAAFVAILLLDLAIYGQHVLFHAVPVLWRLHRMHHADQDIDVTTGVRFHPFEIALSMGIKLAVVVLLGAPPLAVMVFEIILNATAMFNHGNVRLPTAIDRLLRWIIVTPDMHRVHHSIRTDETDRNYGFNSPWWDRLFGTYREQPADGHKNMTIGIALFRDKKDLRLDQLLIQPFRNSPRDTNINNR